MKIQCYSKNTGRNIVFPVKISEREKEILIIASQKENKSMAALIREGYLNKKNITHIQHILL